MNAAARSIANVFFALPSSGERGRSCVHVAVVERAQIERIVDRRAVERARVGVVAAEERGVDDDAADHARQAEPHDAPVVDVAVATGRDAVGGR